MNDIKTVEKSHSYDTGLDLEKQLRQTQSHVHSQQQQIRQDEEKEYDNLGEERMREDLMKCGKGQVYQSNLWWFASTAFPLIAGTFGPIANLFSICSCIQTWRFDKVDGSHVPDPPWLSALNACSLFLAIIANLILLFNFAHRIRYALAQPLTISLWYLSCALLVIPIGLTRIARLSPSIHPTFAYSQSFYYAVISSSIYFTISTLLLLNLIGASRFIRAYPPTFAVLSHSQRTLMLQTISFSLYLALGGGVFSAIEGWSFTDGVYWADYTVLTVGFGSDFPLKKTLARMLLIPYAPFGITLLALVVGSVRGLVLERAKEKVTMRHLGKERDRWMDNINKTLQNKEEATGLVAPPQPRSIFLCRRRKKFQHLPGVIAHAQSVPHQDQHGMWHHAEFELMRYIQITAEQSERYFALIVSFLVFLIIWIGGSLIFWACEHKQQRWTYLESLYFTYTTLLTIGYGDFFPASPAGRPFFVAWSLVAVPAMTVLIGNLGNTVVRVVQEVTDWMGRRTVLPEYREEGSKRKDRKRGEVKNDQASVELDTIRERPSALDPGLVSPEPSFSPGRTLPVPNYADLPFASSSGERQEASPAPQVELSVESRDERKPDPDAHKTPQKSEGKHSGHNLSQVRSEAALLAREITKLAKDVWNQPPKKYAWEEWVNFLKMLGDEGRKVLEPDKEVSTNLPENSVNQGTQVERLHDDDGGQHNHHRRYYSHLNAQFKKRHGIRTDGDEWHWTWLDDKGPLFSQQTETEWILSRLCSRLEHLMKD
ncbi:voltage-gated potassium channel [Phlegmacium glaucopus]|nr:voltage-gated potassium channel [Phlegmacium glaucopus]